MARSKKPKQRRSKKINYEIIERFGRFPHRNAALGRKSTPGEVKFLKQPRSAF